jgi:hypothetical protein
VKVIFSGKNVKRPWNKLAFKPFYAAKALYIIGTTQAIAGVGDGFKSPTLA